MRRSAGARRWLRTLGGTRSHSHTSHRRVAEMNAAEVRIGQLGIQYILDGSTTNSLGIFELTVPSGSNVPPPHSHARNEECVYVLEGKLRYTVGATSRDLGP